MHIIAKPGIPCFQHTRAWFPLFRGIAKINNIHIYILFREIPLSRGARKSARINTFHIQKCVFLDRVIDTWWAKWIMCYYINVFLHFLFPENSHFSKFSCASARFMFSRNYIKSIWGLYSNVSWDSPLHGKHAKVQKDTFFDLQECVNLHFSAWTPTHLVSSLHLAHIYIRIRAFSNSLKITQIYIP